MAMLKAGRNTLREMEIPPYLAAADATQLPFPNETFTKVYASEIVEHVPAWEAVLAEAFRVLKPGGTIVLTTPNFVSAYGLVRGLTRHARRLVGRHGKHPYDEWKSLRTVRQALRRSGFVPRTAVGACYLPGHWVYRLPRCVQRCVVAVVGVFDPWLGRLAPWGGYTLAITGVKGPTAGRMVEPT
jgi:SAM-dependent methyltransferase